MEQTHLYKYEKFKILTDIGCTVPYFGFISRLIPPNTNSICYYKTLLGDFVVVYKESPQITTHDVYNREDYINLQKLDSGLTGCHFIRSYDDNNQVFVRYKFYCIGYTYYWILQHSKTYDFKDIVYSKLVEPSIFDLKRTYDLFKNIKFNRFKLFNIDIFSIDFVVKNYQLINETDNLSSLKISELPVFYAVDYAPSPNLKGTLIEEFISSKKIEEHLEEYNQIF